MNFPIDIVSFKDTEDVFYSKTVEMHIVDINMTSNFKKYW